MTLTYILSFVLFISGFCQKSKLLPKVESNNMVLVKGGLFNMGSDLLAIDIITKKYKLPFDYLSSEIPIHRVKLSSFYIDKYEVTNADYKKFLKTNPQWKKGNIKPEYGNQNYLKNWVNDTYPKGEENFPITYITWYSAMAYAQWIGKRLPSEAEWEFAAKSGKDQLIEYPWGNDDPDLTKANYIKSGIGHATKVGSYPSNMNGIYDLAGNVWEYCLDEWNNNYYSHSSKSNPVSGRDSLINYLLVKKRRVIRGGSWGGSNINLRVTFRDSHPVTGAGNHVGFRCVKEINGDL